jgi:hypothetical protein
MKAGSVIAGPSDKVAAASCADGLCETVNKVTVDRRLRLVYNEINIAVS